MALTVTTFMNSFQSGVYNPPAIVSFENGANLVGTLEDHRRYINVDINPELMKYVIGTAGYYFNAITRASGVSYIWYDKEASVIEVHGPIWCLDDAERRLKERMDHIEWTNIVNRVKQFQINAWSDDTSSDDDL